MAEPVQEATIGGQIFNVEAPGVDVLVRGYHTVPSLDGAHEMRLAGLLGQHLFLQAQSGGGKSYFIRRLCEQVFGTWPQFIFDDEGDFNTLRERYGYLLIAPTGGDIVANVATAADVAQTIWGVGASAIIDLSSMEPAAKHAYVAAFLRALLDSPTDLWRPTLVVVDEVQKYAKMDNVSEAGAQVIRMLEIGRKRGLSAVLATQRIAEVDVSARATRNFAIGLTTLAVDRRRAAEDLGMIGRESLALRELDPGEFFVYGPMFHERAPTKIKVGGVVTTHPKAGDVRGAPPPTPEALKALAADLAKLQAPVTAVIEILEPSERETQEDIVEERDHYRNKADVLTSELNELRGDLVSTREDAQDADREAEALTQGLYALKLSLATMLGDVDKLLHPPRPVPERAIGDGGEDDGELDGPLEGAIKSLATEHEVKAAQRAETKRMRDAMDEAEVGPGITVVGAKAILAVLRSRYPARFSWVQAATLAGVKGHGPQFNHGKKQLLASGLIEAGADLIWAKDGSGSPPRSVDVAAMWVQRLPGPADRMIGFLAGLAGNDGWLPWPKLADCLRMKPTGPQWNNGRKVLRDNNLIEESGNLVRAVAELRDANGR